MEIVPLGDSALIIRVVADFDRDPERSLDAVLAAHRSLEAAAIPGVIELAPAYSTVTVFYDPTAVLYPPSKENPFDCLKGKIEAFFKLRPLKRNKAVKARSVHIPVCYDREFAPDLDDVARATKLDPEEVIRRHARAAYRVSCVGFIAGFPFLSGLPHELATPRRSEPRKQIPAGSVAIGGAQTGIYLRISPGGWNVIGRTPLRLFDVEQEPPTVLQAGDRVRFRKISRREFDSLSP